MTWTVIENVAGEIRVVAQGLTREFAEAVAARQRGAVVTIHPVEVR